MSSSVIAEAIHNVVKHAVVGLVKGVAADLVGTGVTACAVSPGSTRTPMLDATAVLYGMSDVEPFAGNQLLRRLLEPEEVAATIAFCCSREAAPLNGSVVRADRGPSEAQMWKSRALDGADLGTYSDRDEAHIAVRLDWSLGRPRTAATHERYHRAAGVGMPVYLGH